MLYINIRRTGLLYGLGATVVQLGLFYVLAWIGVPLLLFALVCQCMVLAAARPVYVINR